MTKQYKSMTQQYIIYVILGILFIINCVVIYYLVNNGSTISKLQKKVDKEETVKKGQEDEGNMNFDGGDKGNTGPVGPSGNMNGVFEKYTLNNSSIILHKFKSNINKASAIINITYPTYDGSENYDKLITIYFEWYPNSKTSIPKFHTIYNGTDTTVYPDRSVSMTPSITVENTLVVAFDPSFSEEDKNCILAYIPPGNKESMKILCSIMSIES